MLKAILRFLNPTKRPLGQEVKQLKDQLLANLDALERREFTLKKLQEIAQIGSWEYHLDDERLICSDEIYDIAGVDRDVDLKNFKVLEPLLGPGLELVAGMYQRLLRTSQNVDITLQVRTPLGYPKWVHIYAFPVLTNGRVTTVSGIVHDVTRFKEAEELIRHNETKYRSLFEQASDAIMLVDFKGTLLNVNESMCKMLGYRKEELIHLNVAQILDPHELERAPLHFDTLVTGGQVFHERQMVHKDGSLIHVEANVKMFGENQIMAISRDIRERKQIEKEKEYARYLLKERIKELTTLYRASQILTQNQKTREQVLGETALILPEGWQYANICEARISFAGREFRTKRFSDTVWKQTAEYDVQGERGKVEIVYLDERPSEVEGPFLYEERTLINAVAEMLQIYLSRKSEEEALRESQANLSATINNTELFVWSADRNFRLLSFNQPFARYMREKYDTEIHEGFNVLQFAQQPGLEERYIWWRNLYLRALSGENVSVEDSVFGMDFKYSLSPIIEGDLVIGVSAFADNVTDRNQRDRALAEANKKIGELKVMALRSVMNPHFIFNVLNSIQFFIVKNDRLNAINFLSTFSKLIRNVLTYSLNDKIRLTDEIEMLKDYIELEKVRFENKFEFTIEIEEGLEAEHIHIPSLLIQPFVENAILHGLYNKVGEGRLSIRIKESGEYVVFVVEDNGVGRAVAAKIRQQNLPGHKSVGTKLTEERLRLIDQSQGVSVEFEDLMNDGDPTGTRVSIKVKSL
jgi:PAS domain S-box-containing protein